MVFTIHVTNVSTGRYRSKQIYEQEMKKGFIELDLDKVLLFGIAGSGKTCVLHLLLGRDPPTTRNSTPLLKRPIEVKFLDVSGKEWSDCTPHELRETVAKIIQSRLPQYQMVAESSVSQAPPDIQLPHNTETMSTQEETENVSSSNTEERSTPHSDMMHDTTAKPTLNEGLEELSNVDEEFVSLIDSVPPSPEPIVRLRQIMVLDSGGQPEFLEMMPVFLNGASKFVYVFKVHECLTKRPMISYFKDGKLLWEFPATQTNEGTLRQCTRTMNSLSNKNPTIPPAKMMFLGTHRDKVEHKKLPELLDDLHEKLRDILFPQFSEHLIYCDTIMKEFIFTLNAANPGDEDKMCGENIRMGLSKIGERENVEVPLRWYALYQKFLGLVDAGKNVLSWKQCQKLAESMEIDNQSCEEALSFFNGLNMLFYFPDILPNLVFMKPQLLLDKISELVEETYHMRQGRKKPVSGEWLKFRDYGQVTEKFLEEFETHYEPPLFTPKELVILLKDLHVLAEISKDVYFMPCLLDNVTADEVKQYQMSGEKALVLHYPESGPLMGLFCSTIAYLLSSDNKNPCQWQVAKKKKGAPDCLNRNVIRFTIPGYAGTISFIDQYTHFELHVKTLKKKEYQLWRLAHEAVLSGLKAVANTIGYRGSVPVAAIPCPAHDHLHPATVDDDNVWICSETPDTDYGELEDDRIPCWKIHGRFSMSLYIICTRLHLKNMSYLHYCAHRIHTDSHQCFQLLALP